MKTQLVFTVNELVTFTRDKIYLQSHERLLKISNEINFVPPEKIGIVLADLMHLKTKLNFTDHALAIEVNDLMIKWRDQYGLRFTPVPRNSIPLKPNNGYAAHDLDIDIRLVGSTFVPAAKHVGTRFEPVKKDNSQTEHTKGTFIPSEVLAPEKVKKSRYN